MDEQSRKIAELAKVLQQHKSQWEENWRPLSSTVASVQRELQRQVQSIRPSLKAYHTGLAAFSRYQENYLKQVKKALAPWGANGLSTIIWQQSQILTPANVIEAGFRRLQEALAPAKQLGLLQRSISEALRVSTLFPRLIEEQRKIAVPRIYVPNFGQILQQTLVSVREALWQHVEKLQQIIPYWVCELTLYAFEEGNQEDILDFFSRYLDIPRPDEEHYRILWEVLRSGNWLRKGDPIAHVKTAVWQEWKRLKMHEEVSSEWKNLLSPRDKSGLHPQASVVPLFNERDLPLDIPVFEEGFARVEGQALIEWVLGQLNPEEQEALLLWFSGAKSWYDVGRILYGDPNQGRVAGQRIKRKLVRLLAPSFLN